MNVGIRETSTLNLIYFSLYESDPYYQIRRVKQPKNYYIYQKVGIFKMAFKGGYEIG
jgi:hypothetical protein